jgi:flagellar basal-body rod modification protein FlgD
MTTAITYGPQGGFTSTPVQTSTATSPTGATPDRNAVDKDMFLKLLVAQLKYQDPSNPTDPSQFLSQTAQFTTVEKLNSINELEQKVYDGTRQLTAASLVGQTVSYTDASGTSRSGKVTGVSLGSATPNLTIGGTSVSLDTVTSVGDAPPTTTPTTPGA